MYGRRSTAVSQTDDATAMEFRFSDVRLLIPWLKDEEEESRGGEEEEEDGAGPRFQQENNNVMKCDN